MTHLTTTSLVKNVSCETSPSDNSSGSQKNWKVWQVGMLSFPTSWIYTLSESWILILQFSGTSITKWLQSLQICHCLLHCSLNYKIFESVTFYFLNVIPCQKLCFYSGSVNKPWFHKSRLIPCIYFCFWLEMTVVLMRKC